jgi:hypothetical protein
VGCLTALVLTSGCGGSSHPSLYEVEACLEAKGASMDVVPQQTGDPDGLLIGDFIGYQGSLQGQLHGTLLRVGVYDDHTTVEWGSSPVPNADAAAAQECT